MGFRIIRKIKSKSRDIYFSIDSFVKKVNTVGGMTVMRPFVWSSHIHKAPLKIRESSLFCHTHHLYLCQQLLIDIERENILCILDCVSFIEIPATINLYYFK